MSTKRHPVQRRKRAGKLAAGLAAGLLASTAMGSPAAAHSGTHTILHGRDEGIIGVDHHVAWAADHECDPNAVFMQYYTVSLAGQVALWRVDDPDGCGPRIGRRDHGSLTVIISARVCETNVGCTGWHDLT